MFPFPAIAAGAQILGGLFGSSAAKRAAEQQMQGAVIERKIANENAKIYQARAGRIRENAKLEEWRGDYTASRINQQAQINSRLAEADYVEATRAADVVEMSAVRARAFSQAKGAMFDQEAQNIARAATTEATRQYRSGRTELGRQRVATARSGLQLAGTEMDRLVESATRLEMDRFDMLTKAGQQVRQTRFAGSTARFEGDMAAWDAGEQARSIRFQAETAKFNSRVDGWNSEQEAAIAIYESRLNARNMRDEAKDLRTQARLTKMYGAAAYQGALATAGSTRAAGRLGILSGIGDAAGTMARRFG